MTRLERAEARLRQSATPRAARWALWFGLGCLLAGCMYGVHL